MRPSLLNVEMNISPSLDIGIRLERLDPKSKKFLETRFQIQENTKLSNILTAFELVLLENPEFNDADKVKLKEIDCPQAEFLEIGGMNESIENKPFLIDPKNFVIRWDQASQSFDVHNQGRCAIKLYNDKQYKMIMRPRMLTNAMTQREDLLFPIASSEIPLRYNICVDNQCKEKRFSSYTNSLSSSFSKYGNDQEIEALIGDEYVAVNLQSLKEGKLEMKFELDPIIPQSQEPMEFPFLNYMIFRITSIRSPYANSVDSAVACSFDVVLGNAGRKEVERLKTYIQEVNQKRRKPDSNCLAPFINVIHSSGSGKSKLAAELTLEVPSFYLTLSRGYPQRSGLHEIFLRNPSTWKGDYDTLDDLAYESIVGTYLLLLKALISDYLDALKKLLNLNGNNLNDALKQLYKKFVYGGSFMGDDLEVFKAYNAWNRVYVNTETGKFSLSKGPNDSVLTIENVTTTCSNLLNEITELYKLHSSVSESFPFVLTIDSAAYMAQECIYISNLKDKVSLFRLFRLAVSRLDKNCNIVVLCLASDLNLPDFNPDIKTDSLLADSRGFGGKLFAPFIISGNWDTLVNPQEIIEKPVTYDTMVYGRMVIFWLSLGRPLWSSIRLENLIHLVFHKITFNEPKTNEHLLAFWMVRVGLMTRTSYEVTRQLLKSHLATLIDHNGALRACYPSEPALAYAVRWHLSKNYLHAYYYYETLANFIGPDFIAAYRFSDKISADICLHAIAAAVKEQCDWKQVEGLPKVCASEKFLMEKEEFHLQATKEFVNKRMSNHNCNVFDSEYIQKFYMIVRVDEFVKALLGTKVYEGIEAYLPEGLKSARVNTTHFMSIRSKDSLDLLKPFIPKHGFYAIREEDELSAELLQALIIRGAGAIYPLASTGGLNYIIPVCLKPEATMPLTKPEYSYIGVKVFKDKVSHIGPYIVEGAMSGHYLRCGMHRKECPEDCQLRLSDATYSRILKNGLIFVQSMEDSDTTEDANITFECSLEEYKALFDKLEALNIQQQTNEIEIDEYDQSKDAIQNELRSLTAEVCPVEFRDQVCNFVFKRFDPSVYQNCKFIPDFCISFPVSPAVSVHVMYKKGPAGEIAEKLTAIYSRNIDVFSSVLCKSIRDIAKRIISKE